MNTIKPSSTIARRVKANATMPFNKAHLNLARIEVIASDGCCAASGQIKLIRRPGHATSNRRGLLSLITGDSAVRPRGQCAHFQRQKIKKPNLFAAGEMGVDGHLAQQKFIGAHVRFSNRPGEVKHFQTIRRCGFDWNLGSG